MPPDLDKRTEEIVTLAEKGNRSPLDATLFVLDKVHAVEDEVVSLDEKLDVTKADLETAIENAQQSIPDLDKVLVSIKGQQGEQGIQGEKGDTGEQGESIQGPQGIQGAQGVQGEKGDKGDQGEPGKNGDNGKDADEAAIIQKLESELPQFAAQFRDGLELLQDDDRLDVSAVKGIETIQGDIRSLKLRPIGGGKGIGLYIGGSKKLLTAQQINLVAGTGITISYALANGRNDITISASGSVALTPIAMAGTIDDSNKSFTAASTPSLVIVNGTAYRDGKGVSIVGTAITLDSPPGVGGDIYGL